MISWVMLGMPVMSCSNCPIPLSTVRADSGRIYFCSSMVALRILSFAAVPLAIIPLVCWSPFMPVASSAHIRETFVQASTSLVLASIIHDSNCSSFSVKSFASQRSASMICTRFWRSISPACWTKSLMWVLTTVFSNIPPRPDTASHSSANSLLRWKYLKNCGRGRRVLCSTRTFKIFVICAWAISTAWPRRLDISRVCCMSSCCTVL